MRVGGGRVEGEWEVGCVVVFFLLVSPKAVCVCTRTTTTLEHGCSIKKNPDTQCGKNHCQLGERWHTEIVVEFLFTVLTIQKLLWI